MMASGFDAGFLHEPLQGLKTKCTLHWFPTLRKSSTSTGQLLIPDQGMPRTLNCLTVASCVAIIVRGTFEITVLNQSIR